MKATKHPKSTQGGKLRLCRPEEPSRAETAAFTALGFAGLVAVGIAVVWGTVPASPEENTLANARGLPMANYIRSGQLAADVRTAAAALQYLLEAEPAFATNSSETALTQKQRGARTNAPATKPKV